MKMIYSPFIYNFNGQTLKFKTIDFIGFLLSIYQLLSYIFESDREMYKKINLSYNKVIAEKCYQDNLREPHSTLLEMSASLCHTMCKNQNSSVVETDKENIWLSIFTDLPEFKINLEKEKQYWLNHDLEIKEKYKDYYESIKQEKDVLESYLLIVPIKINPNNIDLSKVIDTTEFSTLMSEIINEFNSFGLETYMDSFQRCVNSSVVFSKELVFTFDFCEKITGEQLKECKEDFLGQLSDGWGENASQRSILLDKDIIRIDFDFEKVDNFTLLKKKKLKP